MYFTQMRVFPKISNYYFNGHWQTFRDTGVFIRQLQRPTFTFFTKPCLIDSCVWARGLFTEDKRLHLS